jgi:thiamine-monophosphate kinase
MIERFRPRSVCRPAGVVRGIGDDAAAFRLPAGELALVTTDLLVEGVHFRRETIGGQDLGHKALAVNLSDIAAMGGTPREAFVALAVPETCPPAYLEEFYRGMKALAALHEVNILGGDTCASLAGMFVGVTAVGSVAAPRLRRRDTARPGDRIFTTGFLGDSRAGLHLLGEGARRKTAADRALMEAHRRPRPHLAEGRFLAQAPGVRAVIDISDGLTSDLGQIAAASRVGARVHVDRLPLSPSLVRFCDRFAWDAAATALSGGEDYVLLCTAAPEQAEALTRDFQRHFGRPLYDIGTITDSKRVEMVAADGQTAPLTAGGWDHFRCRDAGPAPDKG